MNKQFKKLIIFDVDGVLLDNKLGGFKDILVLLGKEKEVIEIEEEYQKRKFTSPWGLEKLAELYRGFSKERLRKIALDYCTNNLREGAKETVDKLKKRNFIVGAISSNPKFIMDVLSKILSLNFSEGSKLEFRNSIATGKILRKVDRYIKAQLLKEKMDQFNLSKKDVTVVGDSLTDLPMAKEANLFVAFNPKDSLVKEKANIIAEKKNLKEILKYVF